MADTRHSACPSQVCVVHQLCAIQICRGIAADANQNGPELGPGACGGASQRTVQRALDSLAAAGKVQSFGRGRARRWMTRPVPGFTTTLLLPAPLPSD